MKYTVILLFFVVTGHYGYSQAIPMRPPEHGYAFLPGKKIRFYHTINKYDFGGKKVEVEITDRRQQLALPHLNCSATEINNGSEFAGSPGAETISRYFQFLLPEAGFIVDSSAQDIIHVTIEALDCRMLGYGYITPHGLCQMTIRYQGSEKTYCCDITDKDAHSPIGRYAVVARSTATRIMASAAIREVIEQFLSGIQAK